MLFLFVLYFFFFKQKTAYELRISDWSSDVCSSDLGDAVDDNLENRPAREALLIIGKNALLAGRASKQRFGDKVAQEILAAADERFVANRLEQGQIGRASCRERVCQ